MANSVILTLLVNELREDAPIGTVVAELSLAQPVSEEVHWSASGTLYTQSEWDHASYWFAADGNKIVTIKALDADYMAREHLNLVIYGSAAYVGESYVAGASTPFTIIDVTETLSGTSKADRLIGDAGSDKVIAGAGDDVIFGKAGDDILYGGRGKETMSGEAGSDTFLFKAIGESTAKNPDTITAWDHAAGDPVRDSIDLHSIDANAKISGNQDFDWLGAQQFTGQAGELRYGKFASSTYVYADVNGDKEADLAILIKEPVRMYADDFVL